MVYAQTRIHTREWYEWKFSGVLRDKRIPASRPELEITNKKNVPSSVFGSSNGSQNENKWKWKYQQILEPCKKTKKKKAVEHETDGSNKCSWWALNDLLCHEKKTRRFEKRKNNRHHSDHRSVKIGNSTEKSPRDLSRLAAIQTPVKASQLILERKKSQRVNKSTTVVDGNPKAPFSIATTPRCSERHYSPSWIDPLYAWPIPYNAE